MVYISREPWLYRYRDDRMDEVAVKKTKSKYDCPGRGAPGRRAGKTTTGHDNGLAAMPDLNKTVIKLSKRAYYLMGKRRYNEAEKVFKEAYELDKENAYILVGLGDVYRKLKNFPRAIKYYEEVLALDPHNVFALRGMGNAYRGMQQPEKSLIYWDRYLQCNRYDSHVMVRMADSYKKLGKFDEALRLYNKAMEIGGNEKYTCLGLGTLKYKLGDDDAALACFEKYLVFDDTNVAVLTMMGNICQRRKQFQRAAGFFRKAIERDPDNAFALYGLGNCARGMRDFAGAVRYWSRVLELEPDNQNLYARVGDAQLALGETELARENYEKSLAIGFDPYALLGLANVHLRRQEYEEAEACCRRILARLPDNARALKELTHIYEEKGEHDKADVVRAQFSV